MLHSDQKSLNLFDVRNCSVLQDFNSTFGRNLLNLFLRLKN
jgi:hypothetical protein